MITLIAIVFPIAEVLGYDPIFPEVEEVPLWPRFSLHLHGPHEPANTPLSLLITVQLGQEVFPQEQEVVLGVVDQVAIVVPGKDSSEYITEKNRNNRKQEKMLTRRKRLTDKSSPKTVAGHTG